jgi:tRNA(fMet)-specific endonuclease VapC
LEFSILGIIIDTSLLIASERLGGDATELLRYLERNFGGASAALSVISIVELAHGIYRAKQSVHAERRKRFTDGAAQLMTVHPVSLQIAMLAGRIHGQQLDRGITIDLADLLIGCTALYLDYELATANQKHFAQIPGLIMATLPDVS